jgi:hypothetical protein
MRNCFKYGTKVNNGTNIVGVIKRSMYKLILNHMATPNWYVHRAKRLTDDEMRKLTRIPDNVETRDVLENLLFIFP